MKVLLTGATGVIGLALIEELCARSCDVLVLASPGSQRNSSLACITSPAVRWQECGLSDYESFTCSERFDAMIHMAWSGGMDRWNIDLNLHSARQCAMAVRLAARLECHTFIGTGSQAECGQQTSPLSGDTRCTPSTPFGAAKNLARDLARIEASKVQGMRYIWARILSIYGPRDRETAMVTATLRKLIRGEMPEFSSGEQIWDFLYTDDAARALADMLERGHDGQIYVVGSGNARPLRDYLAALVRPFGVDLAQCLGKVDAGVSTPQLLVANTASLQDHLGWASRVDFDEGVARTIEWCKANPAR
jgi:nucleoside-diphosphate-sugar epimerase